MSFAAPFFLLALLAIPLAVLGYRLVERRRESRSADWSRRALLPNMIFGGNPGRRRHLAAAMFLIALTFLVVGFARPQRAAQHHNGSAPTVVVAVDVSGSMAAADVSPSRIGAARDTAIRFLKQLPARYQAAVVTFGNKARLVVPPTFDRDAAIAGLPRAITPRAGTAIGDAIKQAVSVIVQAAGSDEQRRRPGAVLLLSDGTQTAGGSTPDSAAIFARADGIPVDAVAIGSRTAHATLPVKINGAVTQASVPVDVGSLEKVADETGGAFIADPSASQLSAVYGNLGVQGSHVRHQDQLSVVTAAIALLFTLAGIVLSFAWFGETA